MKKIISQLSILFSVSVLKTGVMGSGIIGMHFLNITDYSELPIYNQSQA